MMSVQRKHVVCFPSAIFGHIIPFLQLARKISQFHDVSFLISELRATQLRERGIFRKEDTVNIHLIGLLDGLDAQHDYEGDVKDLMGVERITAQCLKKVFRSLPCSADKSTPQDSYLELVDQPLTQPADFVIGDIVTFYNAVVLLERGVPCMMYLPFAGLILTNKLSVSPDTPELPDEAFFSDWESATDVAVTGMPKSFKKSVLENLENIKASRAGMAGYIVHSLAELEPDTVEVFRTHPEMTGKVARFVASVGEEMKGGSKGRVEDELISQWLDGQAERSVVYVSFGSTTVPNKEQVKEIAKGLLALEQPFIWSLKVQEHDCLPENVRHSLEKQSTKSKCLIVPWAPQLTILNHKATRLFVTHCGWNSLLEGLDAGIPMLCWPLMADQFVNAKIAQRKGVSETLSNTGMNGRVIPGEEIVRMMEEVGQLGVAFANVSYARKALEISMQIKSTQVVGGSAYQDFMELVQKDIPGLR